jgi:hypothetical protein
MREAGATPTAGGPVRWPMASVEPLQCSMDARRGRPPSCDFVGTPRVCRGLHYEREGLAMMGEWCVWGVARASVAWVLCLDDGDRTLQRAF